jgi:hypothetical protein
VDTGGVFLRAFGEDAIGAAILEEATASDAHIIDGPRLFSTLLHYQSSGRNVDVIYLEAEENIRRSRFAARSIQEGEATLENANVLLTRKDEWGKHLVHFAEVCRWRFDNSGQFEALAEFAKAVARDLSILEP